MEQNKDWDKYLKRLSYQQDKLNLITKTDKAEKFYMGKHWKTQPKGVDTAVMPITQQIVDLKVAVVMSNFITMNFSPEGISSKTQDENELDILDLTKQLTEFAKTQWENCKLNQMNEYGLIDSAVSGDMISYWFWDAYIKKSNGIMGDMTGELIDNVNYFPADPNLDEINNAYRPIQKDIILSFRQSVESVQEEARLKGVSEDEIKKITPDNDVDNRSGVMAKDELPKEDKCNVILYMWYKPEYIKDNKGTVKEIIYHIWARKSTKEVVIRKDYDTLLHRYPVAIMHWRKRKGSAYGEGEVDNLIPNQIMINRMVSMMSLWIKLHGFPKLLYDKQRIPDGWNNDLSLAVPVDGVDSGGVGSAAQYMLPAQISGSVQRFMEWFISTVKDMFGASDALLGQAPSTNTSAIQVNAQNSAVPLNGQKHRFYQYIEDVGRIWLDIWLSNYSKYPERKLEITKDGETTVQSFDAKKLNNINLKIKIDVGASTEWSEVATTNFLLSLVDKKELPFVDALKRMPNGVIPDKQGLIDKLDGGSEADTKLLYNLVAQYVNTLPEEEQQQYETMNVEDVKNAIGQKFEQMVQPQVQPQFKGGADNGMSSMQR